MKLVGRLSVFPALPQALARLDELAHNLWWSWHPEALDLFASLDPETWERVYHNPVKLLSQVGQARLGEVAADPAFRARYDAVMATFDRYMQPAWTWYGRQYPEEKDRPIAYFSAEFGLHESLPIYSGGLGILSGDHCKSSSDLGIPLVGIGLLYNQGYFRQRITAEGIQEAVYERLHFADLPMQPALTPDGEVAVIGVELPGRTVKARVWQVNVGRIRIFLMDTDFDQNVPEDRQFSSKLYGGDHEMRVVQEAILGIGGVRALRTLGIQPAAWHMNEGHSAFSSLERIRELVAEQGLAFQEALEAVAVNTTFTTHTPVPAGNDAFSFELVDRLLGKFWPRLGISQEGFFRLASNDSPGQDNLFSMTILALRTARQSNGVSSLHGAVSRDIWRSVWPGVPVDEVPIGHVTNGIHTETWLAPALGRLFDRHVSPDWRLHIEDVAMWEALRQVPRAEYWEIRRKLKHDMVAFLRERIRKHRLANGESAQRVAEAATMFDPEALTIGFARRFATYKRATLLFREVERLVRILADQDRPVQIVFAGKAHPADAPGKEFIRQLAAFCRQEQFNGRVILIEDYDMNVARYLVQGVDVWLNNPRRPLEASGTSGEKAAANGVLNLSILDGWWPEGHNGRNGWAIGEAIDYRDPEDQDRADGESLYQLLEGEVVPLFFDRDEAGIPQAWLERSLDAIVTLAPQFSTQRMLQDYANQLYLPAIRNGQRFAANQFALAQTVSEWKGKMLRAWEQMRLEAYPIRERRATVGDEIPVKVQVKLGSLPPQEVAVEICHGPIQEGRIPNLAVVPMTDLEPLGDGIYNYSGTVVLGEGGNHGIGVRMVPHHPDLVNKHELGLVRWA